MTILPEYSQTTTGIRNALYPDVAWSGFVGFSLSPISGQPGQYSVAVINLVTSQLIDQSGTLSITQSFNLPEYNADLSTAMQGSGAQATRHIASGIMSRGGASTSIFGTITTIVPSASGSHGDVNAFVPAALCSDQIQSDVAAAAMAEDYEAVASGTQQSPPEVDVTPTAEQEACVEACKFVLRRDVRRAKEDRETAHDRCLRNFGLCYAGCTAAALAGPWAWAACCLGCSVYAHFCESDASEDRDLKYKRIEEDYNTCLRGCGIIIAEI